MRYRNSLLVAAALVGTAVTRIAAQDSLADAYKKSFLVGVAINRAQIYNEDARGDKIIKSQFNCISPENVLKWESVHPKPGVYDFSATDHYVEFGEKNRMAIIGHTLVWHQQTPKWVFEDDKGNPVTRNVLLQRMHDHIQTVVGRYKGRIKGWDVVNEALADDGRLRESPWLKIIGEDYLEKAYEYAHQADPKAELYYNDYALENAPKRNGAIALIKELKAKGVPIHAIGLQGHDNLDWPTVEQQDATITAFESLGIKVNITELDITVLPSPKETADATATLESQAGLNPYKDGLLEAVEKKLAERYAELFKVFVKHRDAIERVTFWGVTDADSWRNDWPFRGRTDYPLLFDLKGARKPAFDAVMRVAKTESQ